MARYTASVTCRDCQCVCQPCAPCPCCVELDASETRYALWYDLETRRDTLFTRERSIAVYSRIATRHYAARIAGDREAQTRWLLAYGRVDQLRRERAWCTTD